VAVGVVFVAFGYVAVGFEQGDGAVEVVVGEVVVRVGFAGYIHHEQGLVEIVAVGVITLGRIGVVGFGQHAPAIIIVAGGGAVGNGLDPPAQGVVGVGDR